MLTPAKIKNHHFDASGRNAYKADSVDSFFEEVSASYEQMFRENGEMYKKIGLLAERLEEYRKDEDNIRNALLTAQRMAEKITREAQEKADSLVNEAAERAKTENDRIDAVSNDKLQKAELQAQGIIAEAQAQAEKMIYDATYESKSAAVSARDTMIKEEATLQMMKVEVTKFKAQILDAYNEQLALIEKLPEIVYAKIEEENAAEEEAEAEAEAEAEEAEAAEEEITEEVSVEEEVPCEEIEDEESAEEEVPAEEPADESALDFGSFFTAAKAEDEAEPEESEDEPADDIDVEQLQQMIDETIDTDVEEEASDDEQENDAPVFDFDDDEYIVPDIDAADEEVEKLSKEISEGSGDIMFTKPRRNDSEAGFKVNLDNIPSYGDAEEIDDDEVDDFDSDNGDGGFSSKLKGFFRK